MSDEEVVSTSLSPMSGELISSSVVEGFAISIYVVIGTAADVVGSCRFPVDCGIGELVGTTSAVEAAVTVAAGDDAMVKVVVAVSVSVTSVVVVGVFVVDVFVVDVFVVDAHVMFRE